MIKTSLSASWPVRELVCRRIVQQEITQLLDLLKWWSECNSQRIAGIPVDGRQNHGVDVVRRQIDDHGEVDDDDGRKTKPRRAAFAVGTKSAAAAQRAGAAAAGRCGCGARWRCQRVHFAGRINSLRPSASRRMNWTGRESSAAAVNQCCCRRTPSLRHCGGSTRIPTLRPLLVDQKLPSLTMRTHDFAMEGGGDHRNFIKGAELGGLGTEATPSGVQAQGSLRDVVPAEAEAVQKLGLNDYTSRAWTLFLCKHKINHHRHHLWNLQC